MKKDLNFIIQWHLTDNCDMRCRHCYISHDIKNNCLREPADTELIKRRLEEFSEHVQRWGITGRINFSGGNPILHEDFFGIIDHASELGYNIGILGNPANAQHKKELLERRIHRYQISLDGLEENHDELRGKGMYRKALHFLEEMKHTHIPMVVLSTVTRQNKEDIPKLAELLLRNNLVFHYDFSRVVPTGEADKELMMEPQEYREFLQKMNETYIKLADEGVAVHRGMKDPLWYLLFKELGYHLPEKNGDQIVSGCGVGSYGLCIDVDGTAYSCRRVETAMGNANEQTLYDLFINSDEMNLERQYKDIEKCGDCELLTMCRGCRAVAKFAEGSYFAKDPQCWR